MNLDELEDQWLPAYRAGSFIRQFDELRFSDSAILDSMPADAVRRVGRSAFVHFGTFRRKARLAHEQSAERKESERNRRVAVEDATKFDWVEWRRQIEKSIAELDGKVNRLERGIY